MFYGVIFGDEAMITTTIVRSVRMVAPSASGAMLADTKQADQLSRLHVTLEAAAVSLYTMKQSVTSIAKTSSHFKLSKA